MGPLTFLAEVLNGVSLPGDKDLISCLLDVLSNVARSEERSTAGVAYVEQLLMSCIQNASTAAQVSFVSQQTQSLVLLLVFRRPLVRHRSLGSASTSWWTLFEVCQRVQISVYDAHDDHQSRGVHRRFIRRCYSLLASLVLRRSPFFIMSCLCSHSWVRTCSTATITIASESSRKSAFCDQFLCLLADFCLRPLTALYLLLFPH